MDVLKAPGEDATDPASASASSMNTAFIKRLKIAVATAIIRHKPSEVSAKEYAESLARRLRQKEDNWKGRMQRLEEELLKTRQELALARLSDAGMDVQISTDLNWNNDNKESTTGSRHVTDNDQSEIATDFVFPTPPCSSGEQPAVTDPLENALRNNARFLHSISQLKSIPQCHMADDFSQTTLDTAVAAIQRVEDFVVEHCHGPWNHGKLLKEAIRGVVGLLDCPNGRTVAVTEEHSRTLLEPCDKLVNRLTTSLVEHQGLNNNQYQQDLCQLLTMLGRTAPLQVPTLRCILRYLNQTSAVLRRTQEGKQDLDYVLFENAFYLCSIFEDVVLVSPQNARPATVSKDGGPRISLKGDVILELHDNLEDCLLHISRDFPVYAQFIWRLTGTLECMHIENDTT